DRVFVMAIDLPLMASDLIRGIAERGAATEAPALIPEAGGRLQPLAAVWRRSALAVARQQVARGELSLHGLAGAVHAEILSEKDWKQLDPSGNSFTNLNTMADYLALRERA